MKNKLLLSALLLSALLVGCNNSNPNETRLAELEAQLAKMESKQKNTVVPKTKKPNIGDYKIVTMTNDLGDTVHNVQQYNRLMVLAEPYTSWYPFDINGYIIDDPDFGQIKKYYHTKDSATAFIKIRKGELDMKKAKQLKPIAEERIN